MNDINDLFIRTLNNKIPKKTQLADLIADVLCIEKETAYRRLRGNAPFSLREAGLIASKLNLSLDEVVMNAVQGKDKPIIMKMNVNYDLINNGYKSLESVATFLHTLCSESYSEFAVTLASITLSLYAQYEYIPRFLAFKYYRIYGKQSNIAFCQVKYPPQKGLELMRQISNDLQYISYTYYILNESLIEELVKDIRYYASIHAITEGELKALKKEIHQFLNDLELLVARGTHKDTGNKVEFYLSNINIPNTYSYFLCESFQVTMITTFILSAMISYEEGALERTRSWIESLKQASTLISGVGTVSRIQFFDKQRMVVDRL